MYIYIWFMPPINIAKLGMDPIADIAEYSHNIRNRIVEVDLSTPQKSSQKS